MNRPLADPPTWLLLGQKVGDNNQVRALAEAVGWPAVEKHLRYRSCELATNLLLRTTLAGVDRAASDPLEPPRPDLVITAGRRNEPVARWVRARSGGRTRIVRLGRTWAHPRHFDLVVTTPQYRLPAAPNVLSCELPFHRVTPSRLREAAETWAPRLAHLPRPWTALLVGGDSGAFRLTPLLVRRLARATDRLAREQGGSVLWTTSARTPGDAAAHLEAEITVPAFGHRFRSPDENPYEGYLALADAFVVTGESVSMLAEAVATARPVHILATGPHPVALPDGPPLPAPWRLRETWSFRSLASRLVALGPARMRRDVGIIHRRLVAAGRAVWLGDPFPAAASPQPPPDDLRRAVERVRALFP